MPWLSAIIQGFVTAIAGLFARRTDPGLPPPPPPEAPGFDAIEAEERRRLDALRDSVPPSVMPPRPVTLSAADRAEDAGAMVDSDAAPTVRRVE